jgi:LmbE family N-acetylglucosaminyl deacetylase
MCFSKLLVKTLSPIPKLDGFDTYAFIGPHPDDIEIGAGATVKRLVDLGKEVHYIIVTDGGCGTSDSSKTSEEVAKTREAETRAAAEFMGVKSVTFLGFGDGAIYSIDEAALKLAAHLAKLQAQIVIAPDPHLFTECHPDHIKTGYAAAQGALLCGFPLAVRYANQTFATDLRKEQNSAFAATEKTAVGNEVTTSIKGVYFYYTEKPNYYFATKKCVRAQIESVALHKSQFTDAEGNLNDDYKGISLYIKYRSFKNGFKSAKGHADCFRALSPLMMHCCAEKV